MRSRRCSQAHRHARFRPNRGQRISEAGTDATDAAWGPDNMIVWGSVTGGTNGTSPVLSDLLLWQDGTVRTIESGTGDIRNPSWSPVGTVIGD